MSTSPPIDKIILIACGTAWHAGLVGKFMIEELCPRPGGGGLQLRVPLPRPGGRTDDTLVLAISQSGETLDTLAGHQGGAGRGAATPSPSATWWAARSPARWTGSSTPTPAPRSAWPPPRPSPRSSRPCTCSRSTSARSAARWTRSASATLLADLVRLPQQIETRPAPGRRDWSGWPTSSTPRPDFLYLGRGINYPIALEGALKLKEISYIHAEGYPAGEMKHGPIALITEEMPVVILAPQDKVYEKILGNIQEVKARDGIVIAVCSEGDTELPGKVDHALVVPRTSHLLTPVLLAIPMQLLAYHMAVRKGCDVDQPRNLAKSVTVE